MFSLSPQLHLSTFSNIIENPIASPSSGIPELRKFPEPEASSSPGIFYRLECVEGTFKIRDPLLLFAHSHIQRGKWSAFYFRSRSWRLSSQARVCWIGVSGGPFSSSTQLRRIVLNSLSV